MRGDPAQVIASPPKAREQLVEWRPDELDFVTGSRDLGSGGADSLREVVAHRVEARMVTTGDDELGKRRRRELVQRELCGPERAAVAEHGDERQGRSQELGRELVGIAADRLQEADDPLVVGQIRFPQCAAPSSTSARVAGCRWPTAKAAGSNSVTRTCRLGTACGGEHHAQPAVGVPDEVGAVAHERSDVLGVAQEVLAGGGGAAPVPATIRHEQAEARRQRASAAPPIPRLPMASDPWTSTTGVPSPHVSTESESMPHTSCTWCDATQPPRRPPVASPAACSVAVAVSTAPASRSTDA